MAAMNTPGLNSTAELLEYLDTLPSLDAHIVDLENQLVAARCRRDAISHRVEGLKAAKAPIRRLPRELLGLIFEQNPEDQRRRNYVMMLVCRLWHSIVLATPRLWCDITLSIDTLESLAGEWKYAAACLSLSHAAFLNIYIDASRFDPLDDPFLPAKEAFRGMSAFGKGKMGESVRLFSFIQEEVESAPYQCALFMTLAILRGSEDKHIGRWRSLYIEISEVLPGETPLIIWNSMDGITSNLQSLDFLGPTSEIDDGWTSTGFPVLPSLTSFSTDVDNPFKHKLVPITQLRQLCLGDSMASLRLLKEATFPCHHVEVLQLRIEDVDLWSEGAPTRTVTLPNLRMLALSGYCHHQVMSLFDVPKLTHLSIVCCGIGMYGQHPMLSTITDLRWNANLFPGSPELLKPLLLSAPLLKRIHGLYNDPSDILGVAALIEGMTTAGVTRACCLDNAKGWPYSIPRGRRLES